MGDAVTSMAELPRKRIVSMRHLDAFLHSDTHADIVSFVQQLSDASVGVKLTDQLELSPSIEQIVDVLEQVQAVADETPPVDNGNSRFGNPAFRTFYDKVVARAQDWHRQIPAVPQERITELAVYFCEAWGNRERVDYGSGMELNFISWLLALRKLGVLTEADNKAIVMRIFWKYMLICRWLQKTYWLEPAGSHGAQGLDDYHFAVFIFGSAQLSNHKYFRPKSIHDAEIVDDFAKDFMYFNYVQYINSIKSASLRWHSPMLDDVSSVKLWSKVNSGMIKMYQGEVLGKLPVVQHFLFGDLLPFPNSVDGDAPDDADAQAGVHVDERGHLHVRGQGFEDCCGIPIPSAFAQAQQEKQDMHGRAGIRRIPFD